MNDTQRPTFLCNIFRVIALVGAIPFLINTLDIVFNPTAMSVENAIGFRPIYGLILAPLTLVIAVMCIRRAPNNLIGWLLVAFAYGTSSTGLRDDMLPLAATVFIANAFIGIFWVSYLLIPLYFPDGYLYPPRINRWGNRIVAVMFVGLFVLPNLFNRNLSYGTGATALQVPNPFFVMDFDYTIITVPVGIFGFIGLGVVTLFLRYRNSSALVRLQLRWLLVGVVMQIGLVLSIPWIESSGINGKIFSALYTIIIPAAIGTAILRHRLYDIDIIIRRTLIYALLTVILAAVYLGSVVLVQQLFRAVTGQQYDLAIVISTLVIAALFTPLRRRIQNTIDRRLYRRKYDAEQTLAAFSTTLRDEVDLDKMTAALVGVVQATMQPTQVSLWVREADSPAARSVVK